VADERSAMLRCFGSLIAGIRPRHNRSLAPHVSQYGEPWSQISPFMVYLLLDGIKLHVHLRLNIAFQA
jgi:hypothetical protein